MNKQAPVAEWQIAENDADWERRLLPALPRVANQGRRLQHILWRSAVLLLLLAGMGGWEWRTYRATLPQLPANVIVTPPRPNAVVPGRTVLATSVISDVRSALATLPESAVWTIEFSKLELRGQRAVVSLVASTPSGTPAYQRTLFYARTEAGWQPTEPDAAWWGPERSLETASFVFSFHEKDEQTVSAVAPRMEMLYATLRRNFGLPISPGGLPTSLGGEKLRIDVSLTNRPGTGLSRSGQHCHISVASPTLYLTPVALSDEQLLAQSIALPLLDSVMVQVVATNRIGSAWQPLRNGLRLWQLWDLDLPLATWRTEVVKWLYLDVPTTSTAQPVVLPKHYEKLCAMHRLWLPTPWQLGIPVGCAGLGQGELYRVWWSQRQPPIRLAQLGLPVPPAADREIANGTDSVSYPGQTIVLATLVEYAVNTYERERLPVLLAGLGQYDSWETLILAVYGVSTAEFEAGWQAYLTARYGVSPDIFTQ